MKKAFGACKALGWALAATLRGQPASLWTGRQVRGTAAPSRGWDMGCRVGVARACRPQRPPTQAGHLWDFLQRELVLLGALAHGGRFSRAGETKTRLVSC